MKNILWKKQTASLVLLVAFLCGAQYGRADAANGLKESLSADQPLTITSEDVSVPAETGGSTAALYAEDGGKIAMNGGTVTSVSEAHGVGAVSAYNGGSVKLDNVTVQTDSSVPDDPSVGWRNYGLEANNGNVTMSGGSITTHRMVAYGVFAVNGGVASLDNVAIETYGNLARGLMISADSEVHMTGGSILAHGGRDDTTAEDTDLNTGVELDRSRLTMDGTQVETDNEYTVGIGLDNGSQADLQGVSVKTSGHLAHGMSPKNGSTINFKDGTILTTGENAHATYSFYQSDFNIENSEITTTGLHSSGLLTLASNLSADKTSVRTTGSQSYGAIAQSSPSVSGGDYGHAEMSLSGVTIATEGSGSHAILSEGDSRITLTEGATVNANGPSSYALYSTGGSADIEALPGNYQISGDVVSLTGGKINASYLDGSLFTGGTTLIGDGEINFQMSDDARWNMTKNSKLSSLEMDGAAPVVDMTQDGNAFGTLTTGALSGEGGTFRMDTDIAAESADRVVVSGTTDGSKLLDVVDKGSANTTGKERTILVETADKNGAFALTNGTVDAGAWKYALRNVSDDERGQLYSTGGEAGQLWELYAQGPSGPGEGGTDTFMGTYYLNYAETDTLMKRLGDLRGDAEHGAWFRGFGGNMDSEAREFAGAFDMDYWGMQVGYDNKLDRANSWFKNGDTYVGGFVGVSNGDLDFAQESGTGDLENHTMGMYATYIGDKGYYFDAIAKYVWSKNEFTAHDSAGSLVQGGKINTGGVGLSLEMGKRIRFNNENKRDGNWYVEPQVQLSWQHMGGDTFHASNGLDIGVDDFNSLIGRVGALVGYESKDTNIYVKASYLKEFDGDMDINGNGAIMADSLEGDWWVYGLGITRKLNERNSLYLDLERASGDEFDQDWNLNAGWRLSF